MYINTNSNKSYYMILLVIISIFPYISFADKEDTTEYEDISASCFGNIIEQQPGVLAGTTCFANDISLGFVLTCNCQAFSASIQCPRCNMQTGVAGLIACDQSCGFDNSVCTACDIWYGGACNCLKNLAGINPGKSCTGSTIWKGPGMGLPPVWILGSDDFLGSHLITSTILNTGIENIYQMTSEESNSGWTFGLTKIDTKSQALALNSKHLRTKNQIHIHLCVKKTNPGSPNDILGSLKPIEYSTFKNIPAIMSYCKATAVLPGKIVTPYTDIWNPKPSTDFIEWYAANPTIDINILSIGLLTDSHNNYLWECITYTTTNTAEHIFC